MLETPMFGETSDLGPIDLLGSLGLNALTTHVACKNPSLRVGIKGKSGDVPAYADFRFLGGVLAAAVGQFGGHTVRRVSNDVALGLLGSYVATETCRKNAIERLNAQGGALVERLDNGRITESALPSSAPAPAAAPVEAGSPNSNYAW
jgi:hypothetical protein